ncbi:MAG: hypothetical protein IJB96_12245 [Lachnospira sp.]|nr:hypothetical protein [Lachnospira sp.]
MELNINTPAYYKEHYGIDDEVYNYCREVRRFFFDKEYSDTLHVIGIVPVAAPQELYDSGAWKESVQLVGNKSCAIISIRMDFEEYYNADSAGKILLIKETVLKAVKKIKSKGKFDFDAFERDFNLMEIESDIKVKGGKNSMNKGAAEKFWNWFEEKEDWIIDCISVSNSDFIWAIDERLKPVFPYFKGEFEFQLGYNDGVGEFFFFHFGEKELVRDSQILAQMMPLKIAMRWRFILEE